MITLWAKISRIIPTISFFAIISGFYSSTVHAIHRVTIVEQLSSTNHHSQKFTLCHSSIAEADPYTTTTCYIIDETSDGSPLSDLETIAHIQILPITESIETEDPLTTILASSSMNERSITIEMDSIDISMGSSYHNLDSINAQQQATIEVQLASHLPEHITVPQITSAAAAFLSVHCGNPNAQPPILFNTYSPDGALEVIVDLHDEIRRLDEKTSKLEKENDRLKQRKKLKLSTNRHVVIRGVMAAMDYYISHWYLTPVSFGLASAIGNFINDPVKEWIAVYEDEPEKDLGSKCLIEVMIITQELIDDAVRQGVLSLRHNISSATASEVVADFTQTHPKVKTFKSTGKFLQLQSSCECQYCEATKQPAEHNLQGRMVDFTAQTDQLLRDLEIQLAYDMNQKLHIKTVISGYFINIDAPYHGNPPHSCKKCPKHILPSSKSWGTVTVNVVTYITGIVSLPVIGLVFHSIKKCLGLRRPAP